MASGKKPSIYVDRGTIGSHDELDEYGVWVKSEPQDMSLAGLDSRDALEDLEDFSDDLFEETSDTDDLGLEFSEIDDLPGFDSSQEEVPAGNSAGNSLDSVFEMDDDFDLPEIGDHEENLPAGETADFDELANFTELGATEENLAEESLDEEIFTGEAFADENFVFEESDDLLNLPAELTLEDSTEDSVEEASSASDAESGGDDDYIEIMLDDLIDTPEMEEKIASAEIPIEAEDEAPLPDGQEFSAVELDDAETAGIEFPMMDQIEEEPIASAPVTEPPINQPLLSKPSSSEISSSEASSLTLSTQLLMKIAEELASIRSELSTLKKDFSSVSTVPVPPAIAAADEDEKIALTGDELSNIISTAPEPEPEEEDKGSFFDGEEDEKIALTGDELSDIINTAQEPEPEEEDKGSFFDGDEDEKIALTGDELSNILNTADFTEEAGADATMEIPEDIEIQEDFTESTIEAVADIGFPEEQDALPETAGEPDGMEDGLEPDFTPIDLDMDVSLEEADLEELEAEYAKAEQVEEDALPELEADASDEEMGEMPVLDIPLDSSDLFETEESVEVFGSIEASESIGLSDLDVSLEEESFPEFASEDTEELKQILEDGIEPITYPPDHQDSVYLSEDPLSVEEPLSEDTLLIDDSIDLSEAVIDEPDLSSAIQDNPIEEPSLDDISISLEMEEDISIDLPEDLDAEPIIEIEEDMSIPFDDDDSFAAFDTDLSEDEGIDISDLAQTDAEISTRASQPASSETGGDLSLIPEGFVVDAAEADSLEMDSFDADSAEPDTADFPDFSDELAAPELMEFDSVEDETISIDDLDDFSADDFTTEDFAANDFAAETVETVEEIEGIEEIVVDQDDMPVLSEEPQAVSAGMPPLADDQEELPSHLKKELRTVLSYMDQLLESLPDEKIEEFAKSEYYDTYKKLFKELGLV